MTDIHNIYKRTLLFVAFFTAFLIKCWMFEYYAVPDAASHQGSWVLASWLAKIAIAGICASFCWISRRGWVSLLLMFMSDIWIMCNLLYFRSNGLYITFSLMQIASNLNGVWNAVWVLVDWKVWIFPVITLVLIPMIVFVKTGKRMWHTWCVTILLSAIMSTTGCCAHYRYQHEQTPEISWQADYLDPLSWPQSANTDLESTEKWYIGRHSIIADLVRVFKNGFSSKLGTYRMRWQGFEEAEQYLLNQCLQSDSTMNFTPQGHLVIVLVESFESWPWHIQSSDGIEVMAGLKEYVSKHPIAYSLQMHDQIRYGTSGDGQMIVNTGLLPLWDEPACMLYGDNTYPNLAHFYPDAVIVNPFPGIWNQNVVTYSYGYKRLIDPGVNHWWNYDADILNIVKSQLEQATGPTCVMGITLSSHAPFELIAPQIHLSSDIPPLMANYLNSIHYTDSCLTDLLLWADTASCMQDATIAILADHSYFRWCMDNEKRPWIAKDTALICANIPLCPFFLITPQVTETRDLGEIWQMDVFPTILHAIGGSGYFWKGLGINQLSQTANPRNIDPTIGIDISDKLIRMNYFDTYK